MARAPIGLKIRERRKALGRTQAALADSVGVSASYLNLIENGKRPIGGRLLKHLANELAVDLETLDAAADRRLIGDLMEIAADPALRDVAAQAGLAAGASADDAAAIVGRYGGWARLFSALHHAYLDRDREAATLADRLNQDPVLSDAVHRMLSNAAAIRSASEILNGVEDLAPAEIGRFHRILGDESRRLADVSRLIAGFFDAGEGEAAATSSPTEEVDALLYARGNVFAALEAASAAVLREAGVEDERWKSRMIDHLADRYGAVVDRGVRSGGAAAAAVYDPERRALSVLDSAPEPTRRFAIAKLAARLALAEPIEQEVAAAEELTTDAARAAAREALIAYCAGAMLMPTEPFAAEARRARYDIDILMRRFQASYEQVAHRLATLHRPGLDAPPFGFMRSDPSGFVTKRYPLSNLALPRRGGACPLWAVYRAFQTPEVSQRQLVEFPSGDRFLFVARAIAKSAPSFERPRHLMSIMLACDAVYADRIVYGDGLALDQRMAAEPVGPSCRLCSRAECDMRQEAAPTPMSAGMTENSHGR